MRVKQSTKRAIELKELLMRPYGWVRGTHARTRVKSGGTVVTGYCLSGGIWRLEERYDEQGFYNNGTQRLRQVVIETGAKRYGAWGLATVNDKYIKNKKDLAEFLDEVIEATK